MLIVTISESVVSFFSFVAVLQAESSGKRTYKRRAHPLNHTVSCLSAQATRFTRASTELKTSKRPANEPDTAANMQFILTLATLLAAASASPVAAPAAAPVCKLTGS